KVGDAVVAVAVGHGDIRTGVTRDSAGTFLPEVGMRGSECESWVDEVARAAFQGAVKEVWGTVTAAVISPVGELAHRGERIVINQGKIGELTQKLYDAIVGIQYGTAPDTHGWTLGVE